MAGPFAPSFEAIKTGNYGQDQFPTHCQICGARLVEDADGSYCPECDKEEDEERGY